MAVTSPALSVTAPYDRRLSNLRTERSSFTAQWKSLAYNISPRRGRFETTKRNKGNKGSMAHIINNRATKDLGTLMAGLMSGVTSRARPWFRLTVANDQLRESEGVKTWLSAVEELMREIFNESNLYSQLPLLYKELGLFGTAFMTVLPDFEDVIRCYTYTIGSYMIANDNRLVVNTLYREWQMTASQLIEEFGEENVSDAVKQNATKNNQDIWYGVVHAIEPNPNHDPDSDLNTKMKFRSVYYEKGQTNKLLRESGFELFPGLGVRWEVTGEDVYGTNCPGMTALGDIRALQVEEKRKAQGIDKMVNPPLKGPGTLKGKQVAGLPGGLTLYTQQPQTEGLRTLYEVNPQVGQLSEDIRNVEERISSAFFADLFLAITNMRGIQPRNDLEMIERKEEKLLTLGPVLESLQDEALDPLIELTYFQMAEAGILPPAPPQLSEAELNIEYISVLAQAQKAVGLNALDDMTNYVMTTAKADESVLDKWDFDQAIDVRGEMLGLPPKLVRSDTAVEEIRAANAQRAAMAQSLAAAGPAADTAKTMSETDTSGTNALTNIIDRMGAQPS